VCFKAVKSGVGYLIIFKFIRVTLFHWNTLVFLAKWFGNVLITWARVCFFVLSCRRISCYYLWCCLEFSWMSVLGTVIVGHDNGSCSYRALVVGTCSVFDYQVVWGIYNCCMFWYFTHFGWYMVYILGGMFFNEGLLNEIKIEEVKTIFEVIFMLRFCLIELSSRNTHKRDFLEIPQH